MFIKTLAFIAAAAAALAAPIPSHGEGSWTVHPAGSEGADAYCLAVDGEPGDGSAVLLRNCDNSQSQGWHLMSNQRGLQAYSTWRFQFGNSRWCLTGAEDNSLKLTYCMDSELERFNSDHGLWRMKSSNNCWDLPEGLGDGKPVKLGECSAEKAEQMWVLQPAEESQMHPFN